MVERFSRRGGIVEKFAGRRFAQVLVLAHVRDDICRELQFGDLTAPLDRDDRFERVVSLWIAQNTGKGRKARAGRKQPEPLAGLQIRKQERSGRLAVDDNMIADPDVLQSRGERAVGNLDRKELQMVVIDGARHGVGTKQRAGLGLKTDHGELTALKTEGGSACRPE